MNTRYSRSVSSVHAIWRTLCSSPARCLCRCTLTSHYALKRCARTAQSATNRRCAAIRGRWGALSSASMVTPHREPCRHSPPSSAVVHTQEPRSTKSILAVTSRLASRAASAMAKLMLCSWRCKTHSRQTRTWCGPKPGATPAVAPCLPCPCHGSQDAIMAC